MEHIADCLAERDPNYAQGLPSDALALFDDANERKRYLALQEVLTDMKLPERAAMGEQFHRVTEAMATATQGLRFCAAHSDGKDDQVFLFISCRRYEKSQLFDIARILTGAALAHYQKRHCFVIVDRDGEHYDVMRSNPAYQPTDRDIAAGEKHFGHLRTRDVDISHL